MVFVVYGTPVFTTQRISSEVLQRSVLGPQLYATFTADAPLPNDTTVLATFADDAAFLSTLPEYPTSVVSLQHSLDAFQEWTSHWKIKVP